MATGIKTYEEFTEFENRLIKRIAGALSRRFGMSRQEQEDAEQEFAMRLWAKKSNYDKAHPSRSSYETYITRCIEKCSFEVLRAVRPEADFIEPRDGNEPISERRFISTESVAVFRALMQTSISKFSPEQKYLFDRISSGETVAEISAATAVPGSTIYTRLRSMRRIFQKNGLDVTADKNE